MSNSVHPGSCLSPPPLGQPSVAQRYQKMQDWLHEKCNSSLLSIDPLAGDASFRRYFRVHCGDDRRYVVMDAPPEQESVSAFVTIACLLQKHNVTVPEIMASDVEQGFVLLSDVGDRLYLETLNADNADHWYKKALDVLLQMQQIVDTTACPAYQRGLYLGELNLLVDWYLPYRSRILSQKDQVWLQQLFEILIDAALAQPQVFVHRDYHSRNLMIDPQEELVVLDFQDAVRGPITYDLVSLLKDAYIAWDASECEEWMEYYRRMLLDCGISAVGDAKQFQRWFDLMGLQRHLKCLGIFVRLHVRDHKSAYLSAIPRLLRYITDVCQRYPECARLRDMVA